MSTVTTRPWFAVTRHMTVIEAGGAECTVLARPTAELAILSPGATLPPIVVTVVPTDYAVVVEPDEADALVTLFTVFPGIEFVSVVDSQ